MNDVFHLTDRHHLEQDVRDLGVRLIAAHEQERIRLSRELHDDVAQRVALSVVELDALRQRLTDTPEDVQSRLARISAGLADIGSELHRLCYELHPVRLELLGLHKSIRTFCTELARVRHITIDLQIAELPMALDTGTALSLYRITQEALYNVVKHSGATRAIVALRCEGGALVLRVVDDGVGFDPHAVRQKYTLGLISMRERARLVHGELLVSSKPAAGTAIEVRVPVASGAYANHVEQRI